MSHQKLVRVCCVVLRQDERILVVQRPPEKAEGLKWEFPGGKIEVGETAEECIQREIREELGVTMRLCGRLQRVVYATPERRLELYPFLAVVKEGKPQLHEHVAEQWLRLKDLEELDLCPADRPIIDFLQNSQLEALAWWR